MEVSIVIPYTHVDTLDVMLAKMLRSADVTRPIKLVRIIPPEQDDCNLEERLFSELKGLSARFAPTQFEIEIGYDRNDDGEITDDEVERVAVRTTALQGVFA